MTTINSVTTNTSGIIGKAISFGSNSYVSGLSAAGTFNTSNGAISFWVKPTYSSFVLPNIAKVKNMRISLTATGNVSLYDNSLIFTGNKSLVLNQWNHVLVSWSGTKNSTSIYVNGSLDKTSTNRVPTFVATDFSYLGCPVMIGCTYDTVTMLLDQFTIYTNSI